MSRGATAYEPPARKAPPSTVRIAILHPSFGAVGGAELLAAAEARALRRDGIDACIVTAKVDAVRWGEALRDVPVSLYPERTARDVFTWSIASRIRLQAGRALGLLHDRDVVVAHNYPCNVLLGAMKFTGIRLWQVNEPARTLHLPETHPMLAKRSDALGNDAPDLLTRQFTERMARWRERLQRGGRMTTRRKFDAEMSARLDGLYAISRYSQTVTRRIYGRCSDTIVYPSLCHTIPSPAHRRGIRRNALQVLAQTRLEPLKNVETVIRGFARFARHHPGAALHIVGEGSERERLAAVATEVAPGCVKFHDFLSNQALAELSSACDAFALLPVDEPFGMVFTEALSRGLLCIGPDHGGPSEILENEEDGSDAGATVGLRIDAFSPDAVEEALCEIVALSDDEADYRRSVGLQRVATRFSDASMVASLRTVLQEYGVGA